MLTVTGIFREKQSGSTTIRNDLRSFHRSLVIVPMGGGLCIKNDILHVTQLTMAQVKSAFKPIAPVPVTTGPVQPPIQPTPTSALNTILPPDDATKLQMIEAMAQLSQMNTEWSRKYVFSDFCKRRKKQLNYNLKKFNFAIADVWRKQIGIFNELVMFSPNFINRTKYHRKHSLNRFNVEFWPSFEMSR